MGPAFQHGRHFFIPNESQMVAQSIASRSRRPQVEPDDELMGRALEAAAWMRKNVIAIAAVLTVVAVLLGAFFWYRADRERREEDAAIAYLPVEQAVLSGDAALAARELDLYIQRHDGTMHAAEARLLLAEVHLREGRSAEALAALADLGDDLRAPLGPQAAMLVGAAHEAAGQNAEAVAVYLRVGDSAPNSFRREEGLAAAARLREQTGDLPGAAEVYARLVEAVENPTLSSMYEMRLAEVEARIAMPQPVSPEAGAAPSAADEAPAPADSTP